MEKTLEQNTYVLQGDEGFGTVKIADDVVAVIAGLAAVEVMHECHLGQHGIGRAVDIRMHVGDIAETIAEQGISLGGASIKTPGAGELGAEPGAAVHAVLDEALVEHGVHEEEVIVAVGTGNGIVGLPVTVGGIGIPLGTVFLIGRNLVGGVSFLRGEHVDSLEKFSCRRL